MAERNAYVVLGLATEKSTAADIAKRTDAEITKAYHRLAMHYDPAHAGGDGKKFGEVSTAYGLLRNDIDPKNREKYDRAHGLYRSNVPLISSRKPLIWKRPDAAAGTQKKEGAVARVLGRGEGKSDYSLAHVKNTSVEIFRKVSGGVVKFQKVFGEVANFVKSGAAVVAMPKADEVRGDASAKPAPVKEAPPSNNGDALSADEAVQRARAAQEAAAENAARERQEREVARQRAYAHAEQEGLRQPEAQQKTTNVDVENSGNSHRLQHRAFDLDPKGWVKKSKDGLNTYEPILSLAGGVGGVLWAKSSKVFEPLVGGVDTTNATQWLELGFVAAASYLGTREIIRLVARPAKFQPGRVAKIATALVVAYVGVHAIASHLDVAPTHLVRTTENIANGAAKGIFESRANVYAPRAKERPNSEAAPLRGTQASNYGQSPNP